jgi:TRAP transporter TAXI family solute receptor
VDGGLAEFSISNAFDLTLATLGAEEYKEQGPKPNLRLAATLMPMINALYVRRDSNIKSIKDLKGKRIASGFYAQKALVRAIQSQLANAELTYDDVIQVPAANIARAAEDFSNGKTDAMFFALGTAGVMEVGAKVGGLRALPIDDSPQAMARMNRVNPSEYAMEVKPGPNMEGITEPTKLVALDNVLFTYARADENVIYKVVRALYENKPDLVASFPPFRGFTLERIATPVPDVDFHPGARRFYTEIHLWPPKR